jgi:hypothetical protein
LSTRFLKSPTSDRASKSAENSPSRYGSESTSYATRSRYSPSKEFKAESMNNLNYMSLTSTSYCSTENRNPKKYYDEFEWEKKTSETGTRRRFDI